MPRTISEPRISRCAFQDFSARKCEEGLDEKDTCPVPGGKKFPAINEVQTKINKRDTGKSSTSKVVSLPKLNFENISEQRIDAGEPYGSNYSTSSADMGTLGQACGNLKQFLKLGASSSEEMERGLLLSDYHIPSDRSSVLSPKILENFEREEEKEVTEESHALKRWEYWLEVKKKVQNSLSKRLGRPVDDLLMQDADKFREVMEQKMMRWCSRLPEPDKWTGSLVRWKPQLRIQNKKPTPQYCLIKSKIEKTKMEFIGIPNPIKKEKGLLSDDEYQNSKRKSKSDIERRVHCKEESDSDSHKVEMEELAVVGTKIVDNTMKSHTSFKPNITIPKIYEESLADEGQPSEFVERKCVFSLVIGEEEIKYEIGSESRQDPGRVFVWNVDFGVNLIGSTSEEVLRVENRGTIAVRYDWLASKFEKKSSFGCLQPRHFEPWFFFNKNSGYFLPGQIYDMKFYFQGRISGIRKETWYLRTNPPLSEEGQLATVVLSGVATEECSTEIKPLDFYLEKRVLESYIYAIIEEMICKALDPCYGLQDIEYRSFFTEKQVFEYHNSKHFYHSSVVRELKKIFEEIPNKNQVEWDLSLTSLGQLIKTYKTRKERSASLREVAEWSKMLYRPNYLPVRNDAGYKMSYAILCKMIDFIEDDYNHIRNLLSEKIEEPPRWRDWGEAQESTVSTETASEEMGEADSKTILQIRPINFMFFRALVHIKTYRRICEAAEQIAGVFETRKKFKSWKALSYKPQFREAKRPSGFNSNDFWPEEPSKPLVNILTLK